MLIDRFTLCVYCQLFLLHFSTAKPKLKRYPDELYFDFTVPETETVLTEEDFALANLVAQNDANNYDGESWDAESMYNTELFEGDIANPNLNSSTVEAFMTGAGKENGLLANAIKNRYQLWQGNKIPYAISSQYSSYSRSLIASSMKEYAEKTCIQFVPRSHNTANYLYIVPDRGCYSMVGRTGGRQTVSLGHGCVQSGIIVHELMHAVGFFHEQSRTDRDNYISILWHNIAPGMSGQFQKYSQQTIQFLGAQYDYNSIMHYGPTAFSSNGQPTIVPKTTGARIGQRSGFSNVDTYKINKLYQCDGPTGVVTTARPTRATWRPTQTATWGPTRPTFPTIITRGTTTQPVPGTLPPPTQKPTEECKDLRKDCLHLSQQGWCKRNPGWMKRHCPISCDMCEKKPAPECEDLRVDCTVLVQKRYCKTSPSFMESNCAKACGYCTLRTTTVSPGGGTTPDGITQRPNIITSEPLTPDPTEPPTTQNPFGCVDRKHYCVHWKAAGFCEGIFLSYMKVQCPQSCGLC